MFGRTKLEQMGAAQSEPPPAPPPPAGHHPHGMHYHVVRESHSFVVGWLNVAAEWC
jgi:hypothetical protein